MRISVVIPTFNSGPLVEEAVASVRAQTHPPFEIIVVDDGSTDGTNERLKSSDLSLISQTNAGPAAARNAGMKAATGDAIAFLDADDVWHPRKLELQVPHLQSHGLVATGCYDWPGPLPEVPASAPPVVPIELKKLVVRNSIVTSTVLARTDVLRKAGDFDTRLRGPEDYDLWLRVAQASDCAFLSLPLTGYRTVAGSLSKNAERMEAGMRLILAKLEDAGVFRGQPLLRRKAWGYFHYSCGYMHRQAGHRREAKKHLRQSLLKYPLWYGRDDVRYLFGRARLLLS
jgi:glycosyltransferase involved in cell wall biosynthesis